VSTIDLDAVLTGMVEAGVKAGGGVSDLNFTVGKPAQVEANGVLQAVPFLGQEGPLTSEHTTALAFALVGQNKSLQESLEVTGACDGAYGLPRGPRFRFNVFRTRGHHAIVLRALPGEVPSFESLQLPAILQEIPKLKNGIVLVTGATGSGKSTTLAALIDRVNTTRAVHVLTLEDPIEFTHRHKLGTVNQRELGSDFPNFAAGLKAALRQAPKVILVGEMRDRETVEIGLKAAETGHLVLSTLHTVDAGQTINRIVGLFEQAERNLVRSRLAQVVRFVVGQRLLPKEGGGRIAALEVMGQNLRIRELIQNGETSDKTFYQAIADSKPYGWQTFDQHILEHFQNRLVSLEVAKAYASDVATLGKELDRVRNARGEQTSDLGSLEMVLPQKGKR
jgi:twitching motility protein PilT